MQSRKPKFRVPTEHGGYEAEGVLQVVAIVIIELVRNTRAFAAGVIVLAAAWGVKVDVLALINSIFD